MSKFNSTTTPGNTKNLAGGSAYIQNPKMELASILLTSFLGDGFYRSSVDTIKRMQELVIADPLFAAKAALYARNEIGMRSVSHVVAAHVAQFVKGEQWTKHFFEKIVRRPDDMLEILAYRKSVYGMHPIPNAIKKGFARKLESLDLYALSKYRGEGKEIGLVDVVNLTHPHSTPAIDALMKGEAKAPDTWEHHLSHADDKGKAWAYLINNGKVGHFALLRNMKNIAMHASDETFNMALDQLTNPEQIKKSLVLPFRYYTAYKRIEGETGIDITRRNRIMAVLDTAATIAVDNVPDLPGTTLIAVDTSGSMTNARVSDRSGMTVAQIAALFACALNKRLGHRSYVMTFDTEASQPYINPNSGILGNTEAIVRDMRGGGTNLDLPFAHNQKVDRVIVLSDMQTWTNGQWGDRHYYSWERSMQDHKPAVSALDQYRQRTGSNPHVYGLDLRGYGTMQFPASRCYQLVGWSEKVFDLMPLLEENRNALVNKIEGIEI